MLSKISSQSTLKALSFLLVAIFISSGCYAQDEREILDLKLESIASDLPNDKVFLHTDRSLYQPGDTINFQSYIADRFTHKFETASLTSYVLLTDIEGNKIDSARFRIDYALAPGYLTIPDDCKPGWYCIKAFTSLMQNFDPEFAFSSWIRIDELIKNPVGIAFSFDKLHYNLSDTAEVIVKISNYLGEPISREKFSYTLLVNDKIKETFGSRTNSAGESILRLYLPGARESKKISLNIVLEDGMAESIIDLPLADNLPDIAFLPEGGTLIPDYNQRVAFNAVRKNGEQLYLRGAIFDSNGSLIDSIRSGNIGPGLFSIRPESGESYYAVFNEFPAEKWNLPELNINAPSIKVVQANNSLLVDLMGMSPDSDYYAALSMNYNIVSTSKIEGKSFERLKILTDSLPAGTARITFFTHDLKPIAERCIIIRHKNKASFSINPEYEFYVIGQESEVEIEIKDKQDELLSGLFSLAVIDSSSALSPQLALKNIEDEFMVEKEIYDRIPDHLKAKGLSSLSEEELDLLMMTYGWLKYKWDSQLSLKPKTLTWFDLYRIEVETIFTSKKRKEKDREYVFVKPVDKLYVIDLDQVDNDSYILNIDKLDPLTSSIRVVPNHTQRKRVSIVTLSSDYNQDYFASQYSLSSPELIHRNSYKYVLDTFNISLDSVKIIKGIDVFAKRKPVQSFVNQHEEQYQNASTRSVSGRAFESSMSFIDMLRKLTPREINMRENKVFFRGPPAGFGSPMPPPALFVVDGIPHGTSFELLTGIRPEEIHSMTVLLGSGGAFVYGSEARGSVVFVETKANQLGGKFEIGTLTESIPGDVLKKELQLFRANAEFYSPPKDIMDNDPDYWIRPTLFWNSECFYDGKNPLKIKYLNHQKKGPVYIIVNGVTSEGEPVSGVHRYVIK